MERTHIPSDRQSTALFLPAPRRALGSLERFVPHDTVVERNGMYLRIRNGRRRDGGKWADNKSTLCE